MWPSPGARSRAFSQTPCPDLNTCTLPNCIFSHELSAPHVAQDSVQGAISLDTENGREHIEPHDNDGKSIRISPYQASVSRPESVESALGNEGTSFSKEEGSLLQPILPVNNIPPKSNDNLPKSATRPVSPPPTTAQVAATSKPSAPVRLIPRKLMKEPAPFNKRITFLKALHGYLKTQNDRIARAVKPEIRALHLDPNELNKLAVDEEEQLGKDNPSVYENILKQRLVKLKSMTPEAWVKERREKIAEAKGDPVKKAPPKKVETGLSSSQELVYLKRLVCSQEGLDKHGYVTKIPSDEAVKQAQDALDVSDFWEVCDRCETRFQAFPERRQEDGVFCTRGPCRWHWGKRNPPKGKRGGETTRWSCCQEPLGTEGCTKQDTHVYKVKSPSRLSLVMPFAETPNQDKDLPQSAVCFDCEMGYTTRGFEMLRLTVLSWPDHRCIIDVLVRPLGHILDLNTRYSGITTEQFTNARPFDPANPKPVRKDLRIVESPYKARELFFSHITPSTPVLGHALENDLNTIRIVHPTIVDTVLLFPHHKGLPFRQALKYLAREQLGENIQQASDAGHDSYEDARTTGELVRVKIRQQWRKLVREGWTVTEDRVLPPMPDGPPPAPLAPSMFPATSDVRSAKSLGKRKADDLESGDSDVDTCVKSSRNL